MNSNIKKLYQIANKDARKIIGLMSGTSVDGLDVALCQVSGSGMETKIQLMQFETVPYEADFKEEVKSIFSKKMVDLEKVCLMNPWIALKQAGMILHCLSNWGIAPEEIDLIASHGQTIYHAPKILHLQEKFPNATLQIGDGDHLAVKTGIITLSDFRQKHIAAGGEGAPLAVYGDYLIFSKKGEDRIMLNMGGISNFTFLPGTLNASEVFSTDTGPGNTMMDAYIQKYFPGKYYDENAELAAKGKVNEALLRELKNDPFFTKDFPKTTGPELFNLNYLEKAFAKAGVSEPNHENTMATLNRFSADTICDAIKRYLNITYTYRVFLSGGGMHNPLLRKNIEKQLPTCKFYTTAELEISPDAKEAVLFALLANECICGGSTSLEADRNGIPSVSMGKISFPS